MGTEGSEGMGIAGEDKDAASSFSDLESRRRRRRRQTEARRMRMENEEEVVIGDMLRTAWGILGCLFLSLSPFPVRVLVIHPLVCLLCFPFHLCPLTVDCSC